MIFTLGLLAPSAVSELSYVAEVAAGATNGAAVNRAQAISQSGLAISNRAEAMVEVSDDFFRSSLQILGRIVEDGCDGPGKALRPGKGVEGVRLYLETGATVVSDENGLYHFEDVTPRTHVVQVDEASLPAGYELAQCVNNTRFAGSARSQFVDAKGGKIWRANFYVKKVRDAAPAASTPLQKAAFNADKEYLAYDKVWLNQQQPGNAFAYPADGVTPSSPSVNIGIKHDAKLRPTLLINGAEAPLENFAGRDVGIMRTIALSRWKGVDLKDGVNKVEAILKSPDGAEVARLTRSIDYIDHADRATLVPERTIAFADGKTRPVIAIRVTDGAGRAVRAGHILNVEVAPPYRTASREAIERSRPLDAPLSALSGIPVGQGGVALIELEPTVETGLARIEVKLANGERKAFTTYVKPALARLDRRRIGRGRGRSRKRRRRPEESDGQRAHRRWSHRRLCEGHGQGRLARHARGRQQERAGLGRRRAFRRRRSRRPLSALRRPLDANIRSAEPVSGLSQGRKERLQGAVRRLRDRHDPIETRAV